MTSKDSQPSYFFKIIPHHLVFENEAKIVTGQAFVLNISCKFLEPRCKTLLKRVAVKTLSSH